MINKYTLSKSSANDLKEIIRYSLQNFGKIQTDQYLNGLEESLDLLASNPNLGIPLTSHDETSAKLPTGFFYHRYTSHIIYFKKRTADIFIVRILHKNMLPDNYL